MQKLFYAKCQGITDSEYKTTQAIVWICSRGMWNDIELTVKGNPLDYLEYANSLHKNLQFTLEIPNGSGELAFLYLT